MVRSVQLRAPLTILALGLVLAPGWAQASMLFQDPPVGESRITCGLKQAQSMLEVLKTYTWPKTVKALDCAVDQTRFDERARGRVLQLEQARLEQLEKQVERCLIVAPTDGRVVLARHGAVIRQGGLLLRIVPSDNKDKADHS